MVWCGGQVVRWTRRVSECANEFETTNSRNLLKLESTAKKKKKEEKEREKKKIRKEGGKDKEP